MWELGIENDASVVQYNLVFTPVLKQVPVQCCTHEVSLSVGCRKYAFYLPGECYTVPVLVGGIGVDSIFRVIYYSASTCLTSYKLLSSEWIPGTVVPSTVTTSYHHYRTIVLLEH